jgi:hypothetical protein
MIHRQQPISTGTPTGHADLRAAGLAVRLPASDAPNMAPADMISPIPKVGTTAGPVADALAAEALAKRRVFIQALARQAARELAAQALAARDE